MTDVYERVSNDAERFRAKNEQRIKAGWRIINHLQVQAIQSDSERDIGLDTVRYAMTIR